jgi:hypothetical protein
MYYCVEGFIFVSLMQVGQKTKGTQKHKQGFVHDEMFLLKNALELHRT